MALTTIDELSAGLQAVWVSVAEACEGLTDDDWRRPTALAGWSVQDNLSHMVGGQLLLLGRPEPERELAGDTSHIRSDMGRWMEYAVEARRSRPGAEVLDELTTLASEVAERLTTVGLEDEVPTPFGGTGAAGRFLPIVVFDQWAHEQDIRRALDRPGHMEGPVPEHVRDSIFGAWQAMLPSRVEGVGVDVVLTGPVTGGATIGDGRVRLTLDLATLNQLACGRVGPTEANVKVEGDEAEAQSVLAALAFTP